MTQPTTRQTISTLGLWLGPQTKDERVQAILNFDFDDGDPSFRFVDRLARENAWTLSYAEKVVCEYRRFLVLAALLPHEVTPSEDVDQAWHLHLTFTQSYWQRLCRETLGFPLHHHPTRGGVDERTKFDGWYNRTLEAYENLFHVAPPDDIWPSSEQRFSNTGASRWIDTSRHWVVKKPTLRRLINANWFIVPMVPATTLIGQRDLLDLDGPSFLIVYAVLVILGVVASLIIRMAYSKVDPEDVPALEHPLEIACLAGGRQRSILAALTALIHRGNLVVEDGASPGELHCGKPLPNHVTRLERLLFDAVGADGGSAIENVVRNGDTEADVIADSLRERGLMQPDSSEAWQRRGIPCCIMGAVAMFGLVRLWAGISQEKPVGCLFLLLGGAVLAWWLFCRRGLRTPLGDAAYTDALVRSRELRRQWGSAPAELTPGELAMIVGIEGLGPLVGHYDSFVGLYRSSIEPSPDGGCSGCGGGGCGGCGCGG
jgi:uncharacterized protein (TIGR04222 family)